MIDKNFTFKYLFILLTIIVISLEKELLLLFTHQQTVESPPTDVNSNRYLQKRHLSSYLTDEQVDTSLQIDDSSNKQQQQQDGSWAQWWSYDGISGPDYWNINKRWRLCNLGRKQSPIELRTDRLVYDHLLGPIRLSWLGAGVASPDDVGADGAIINSIEMKNKPREEEKQKQNTNELDPTNKDGELQKSINGLLLNSGRGVEVWLEGGTNNRQSLINQQQSEQLILSKGPLSYAYKLYKIEIHSAITPFSSTLQASFAKEDNNTTTTTTVDNNGADNEPTESIDDDKDESVPDTLKSGKSSEHLIDGKMFNGELQLHFYNKHLVSSAQEALQQLSSNTGPDSSNLFAAISVFIITTANSIKSQNENEADFSDSGSKNLKDKNYKSKIDFILDNLDYIQDQGNSLEVSLNRKELLALIPSKQQYITYQGSLNRPPCSESVDWILINKALLVDSEKFRGLFDKLNTNQENVRPIKPLHRRLLRTTINTMNTRGYKFMYKNNNNNNNNNLAADEAKVFGPSFGLGTECPLSFSERQTGNKNCTTNQRISPASTNGREEPDSISKNRNRRLYNSRMIEPAHQKCSMKPKYSYQLRYMESGHNN